MMALLYAQGSVEDHFRADNIKGEKQDKGGKEYEKYRIKYQP